MRQDNVEGVEVKRSAKVDEGWTGVRQDSEEGDEVNYRVPKWMKMEWGETSGMLVQNEIN